MMFFSHPQTVIGWCVLIGIGAGPARLISSEPGPSTSRQKEQNGMDTSTEHKHTNLLIHATSPYLLQHAHNPVEWNEWSQEALEEYIRDRGGNLIVVAGRDNMPQAFARQTLARLLPVQVDRRRRAKDATYFLELTNEGQGHNSLMIEETPEESHRTWRNIYRQLPIHFLSTYSRPKPSARTLIEAIPRHLAVQANRVVSYWASTLDRESASNAPTALAWTLTSNAEPYASGSRCSARSGRRDRGGSPEEPYWGLVGGSLPAAD